MRLSVIPLVSIGLAILAGCATQPNVPDAVHSELVAPYQLDSGDQLRVIVFGQDENFYEWEQAAIYLLNASISWRPTTQLRVDGTYALQRYDRRTDGTTVAERQIPRVKVEYQLSRAVFVRLVTEYDAQSQAALRDDRNGGAPILFYNPANGTYTSAIATDANRVHLQGLFSYQPMPGTVFFAGYGALLDEPTGLRFNDYNRLNDGFFVKLSYLFRAR